MLPEDILFRVCKDKEQATRLLSSLYSFRDVRYEFDKYPDKIAADLMSMDFNSSSMYFPCDLIELRGLLTHNLIKSDRLAFFSLAFAKKYFVDYPVLLVIEKDKNADQIGPVLLPKLDFHSLDGKLKGVLVRIRSMTNEQITIVNDIVSEINPSLNINVLADVLGLSEPKIAATQKKYKVVIDTLHINETTLAATALDAVRKVLARAWDKVAQEKGIKVRPSKYTAEYWLSTPFWDDIVKEAAAFNLKQASSPDAVKLSSPEQQIFGFLESVKKAYPDLASTELRVAGGWVRDKLLNKENDDIDIAINNMTGSAFLKYVVKYAKEHFPPNGSPLGKSYIVDQNIEKSKHLETVGVDIFGQKVEFVNLRSEEYGDSRIPTMRFGTPQEDAARRDLTINAMFYNLQTKQVEDYVGGIEDLKTMRLRTPLNPVKTFKDDPLRMLRVLRFFSRYPDAKIDPELIKAMSMPEVQSEYAKKLSPERSSAEFRKMMQGAKPDQAVMYLFETGLWRKVFFIPENYHDIGIDQKNPHHDMSVMNHTLAVIKNMNELAKKEGLSDKDRGLLNFAALFHDMGKLSPEIRKQKTDKQTGLPIDWYSYIDHDAESTKLVSQVMKQMAFEKDEKDVVESVVKHHMRPHKWDEEFVKSRNRNLNMGTYLEDTGDMAKNVIYHAIADASSKGETMSPQELDAIKQQYMAHWQQLENYKQQMGDMVIKPLLDGHELMQMMPKYKPSSGFIRIVQDWLKKMQKAGRIKNKEEAVQWVTQNMNQLDEMISRNAPKTKLADVDSNTGGWQGPSYEGSPRYLDQSGQMIGANKAASPYQLGDKVRLRAAGVGFAQTEGRVVEVDDAKFKVEWQTGKYKGKITTHSLSDPTKLALLLEKA